MLDREDLKASETALVQFFKAMRAWELEAKEISEKMEDGEVTPDEGIPRRREALAAIEAQYLCQHAKLPRSKAGISYSDPPEYGMEESGILIEEVCAGKGASDASITVLERKGMRRRLRYLLKRDDGRWKLFSKHVEVTPWKWEAWHF